MKPKRYDWMTIEKEYIQGIKVRNIETGAVNITFPTHQDICDKYGCAYQTVKLRSYNNKWSFQRQQYQRKLNLKNNEICPEDLLGESAKFDSLHLTIAEGITQIIIAKLEPHLQLLNEAKNDDGSTNFTEGFEDYKIEELPPLSIKELRDISAILKENHTTVRSILGETTTESLLEDVRNTVQNNRQNKLDGTSKLRIKKALKEIEAIQVYETELEIKRKEYQKLLDEKNSEKTK